jgi:HD-GYP domain-containing protein (c-di-GMP phosphodiesterase class II)
VAPIVHAHHERWDGSGYPRGLARTEIPIGARVVAVVDAFDAIVHGRPSRPRRSVGEAMDEIARGGGTQFDPELTALFVEDFSKAPEPESTLALATTRGLRILGAA